MEPRNAMQRCHHGRHAGWLRAALLVAVCLGGLAGCATLTDVAAPTPGKQLDGVREEMGDLRAAVEQLHAAVNQLEAGLRERDALLGQLTARLHALEQDVVRRARPSGEREVLPAIDLLPAVDSLVQRLREVERRLTSMEAGRPAPSRADAPREQTGEPAAAGSSTARPGRQPLQPGMSQAEVRGLLGAPVSVDDTSDFIYWYYGTTKDTRYIYFDRGTGRVSGWLGF